MLSILLSILCIVGCVVIGNIMNDSELRGLAIWGVFILAGSIAQYKEDKYDKR